MNKRSNQLDILAIGVDSSIIEALKRALKENRLNFHLSYLKDIDDLDEFKKKVHAVFFFSNRQSPKTIDDIRQIRQRITQTAIILLSPKPDLHGVIGGFRAGLFDFLTLPLESNELRTVIYRLKLYGAIQGGQQNPERAVLQIFSRPESFSSVSDIAAGLNQYLNIFFKVEKDLQFNPSDKALASLAHRLKFSEHQQKRIKRFLSDETGLIFGLRFYNDHFYFLVKSGKGRVSYLMARKTSDYSIKEILSNYLSNVLKTSVTILLETKKREHVRMLALTDEVTGLFNQRKLIEDLELFIGRYEHDRVGFSLLFVDIDYFKNVNDQYGHVVGSQLLMDMSLLMKSELRSSDLVYRYGGDEFIILLPRTGMDEAKNIALRISKSVKDAAFMLDNGQIYKLSLSVGLAGFPQDAASAKAVIEFADRMMYMSKKSGRGKVFHITEVVS